mmetsp:Transcript_65070/g.146749  ORF Transcript_65070/g.146749 Transcript_65070/m.146749 type:complete len:111 (-) Transcript_65070:208-540(-)
MATGAPAEKDVDGAMPRAEGRGHPGLEICKQMEEATAKLQTNQKEMRRLLETLPEGQAGRLQRRTDSLWRASSSLGLMLDTIREMQGLLTPGHSDPGRRARYRDDDSPRS